MVSTLKGSRIAIYARYSSDKQKESSIEDQVRRCRAFATTMGATVEDDLIFADYAVSGASANRPGLERLMSMTSAKPRTVDVIITEDVSRISRDLADGADIFRRLRFAGVQLLGVADGLDSSSKNAKVTFTVKSLVADIYLDDLRDKTLRGLEGRALADLSTGGFPFGYRSVLVYPGKPDGPRRIEIDPEKAKVVVWIFETYLAGWSLTRLAQDLNQRQVPPPRAGSRHRSQGWVDSTVRSFLHNEKYTGRWTFKTLEWVKEPGTGRRTPRPRDEKEIIVRDRPDLRIIAPELWEAVLSRLGAVRAHFVKRDDERPRGVSAPNRGAYPFSGLLVCGVCRGPMVITGGHGRARYSCSHTRQRGTCLNRLSVREDVTRSCLLAAISDRLASPAGIAYARKRLAERLGELSRNAQAEIDEHRGRLRRTEERIGGLVQFIADGDQSAYVRQTLLDLEAQARAEKAAIAEIERTAAQPIRLPTPDALMERVFDLEARVKDDPLAARERLRALLRDGQVRLDPGADGIYVARTEVLPLVLLAEKTIGAPFEAPMNASGSGGKI